MLKAIIPARSGSTRVVNKNIRPFADSNLLVIKIEQLKRIRQIDGIIVNSNDDEILSIAKKMGVDTVKRDPYFATNTVSINEVYVDWAKHCDSDDIIHCNVTNPLLEDDSIRKMIDFFYENKKIYKSINSSNRVSEFMWLNNAPINYDVNKMPRSQDLPNIQALNFAVNILSKKTMIDSRNLISDKPFLYELSDNESVDVDWPIDFEFAEFLYNKNIR